MNDVTKKAWAAAVCNEDFLCLETYSGYRSSVRDPNGLQFLMDPDPDIELLGANLLETLARSRFVLPVLRTDVWIHPDAECDADLYDYKKNVERNDQWVQALMKRYGYKAKRTLFKYMMSCSIESVEGLITIRPSHHETLESWSGEGMGKENYVSIPADSSSRDVGTALRLAFSRCT